MKDQYLVRRDVLDRIHQNPNAVPVVDPDEFGATLLAADTAAVARDAAARAGLPPLSDGAVSRLANLDRQRLIDQDIKGNRDLFGFLDKRGYDDASPESYAAWAIAWDGMRHWDNLQWSWPTIAVGVALIDQFCPVIQEYEQVVLARGSTGH